MCPVKRRSSLPRDTKDLVRGQEAAAKAVGISRRTLYGWIKAGYVKPAAQLGDRIVFYDVVKLRAFARALGMIEE